jgi:hypothetical protein
MATNGYRAAMRLAKERPEWIPAVLAALVLARRASADPLPGDEFAGAWVLGELVQREAERTWYPNLRLLVSYGVLEKSGASTRHNQRAYYRMPDPEGVSRALNDLGQPEWPIPPVEADTDA